MALTEIATENAPGSDAPLSQGIVVNGLLFTAGFNGRDALTGELPPDVAGQTAGVLRNIEAVLVAAGASMADVVKCTVHLEDLDRDRAAFNEAYAKHFTTRPFPVRTTVGSHLNGILVEIDVVAALPTA